MPVKKRKDAPAAIVALEDEFDVRQKEDISRAVNKLREGVLAIHDATTEGSGELLENLKRITGDFKAGLDELKASEVETARKATEALEIAKAERAMAPGQESKINGLAMRSFPMAYKPDQVEIERGISAARYNLLAAGERELRLLDKDTRAAVESFRYHHDACAIFHAAMIGRLDDDQRAKYLAKGGVRTLEPYPQYERLALALMDSLGIAIEGRALSTSGVNTGAEWIPTGFASQLAPDIRPELELASYFETVPMPTNPYKWPVQGNSLKAYKVPENVADAGQTQIGLRTLQTFNVTFDADMLAALMLFSTQFEQDSIVPVLGQVRTELAFSQQAAVEDFMLNGQVTSVFDAGSIASDDCRTVADGLRWAAQQTGVRIAMTAGVTVERLARLKGLLRKFGKTPSKGLWITSYLVYALLLTLKDNAGNAVVLTQDKVGPTATIKTGLLGAVLGSPIVVPDDFPEDMGDSGTRITNGDRGGILYAHRDCYKLGERLVPQIEGSRERFFDFNQVAVKITSRYDGKFLRTPAPTYQCVGRGDDIALAG